MENEPHFHIWLGDFALPATTEQWAHDWVNWVVHLTGVRRDMLRILGCRAKWIPPACIQAAEMEVFSDQELAEERDDIHEESADEMDAFIAFQLAKNLSMFWADDVEDED